MRALLRGNIVCAPRMGELTVLAGGYLALEDGVTRGLFEVPPEKYALWPVEDLGDALILPAPVDAHLHAPQFPVVGTGMDLPLLPWLDKYIFPAERRFADPGYAREVYAELARELARAGTTRAVAFGSIHEDTCFILMEELEKAGLTALAGKVNMDRNSPPDYVEETGASLKNTRRWIEKSLGAFSRVKPIATPRYIPTCSDALLEGIAELAREFGLPVQSHLSENRDEVKWVHSLHPECSTYAGAYHKFGLLGPDTVMAHCVLSGPEEISLLAQTRTLVAHCPDSNLNLSSGMAPVRRMLEAGVRVSLGSDIAAGAHISMFSVMACAVRVSKMLCLSTKEKPLAAREAFYLGTAPAAALFHQHPLGVGEELHALVIEDKRPDLPLEDRLERVLYRLEPDWIARRYAGGRRIG